MRANLRHAVLVIVVIAAASVTVSCGEYVRQGNSPVQVVITLLEGASGATPDRFGGTLDSDVLTIVNRTIGGQQVQIPTIFNDVGRVTMRLNLKDQGVPGVTNLPSPINEVTFSRYRVSYRRADGRNTPGIDVPFPFDSGITFTVPSAGTAAAGFELVRHVAKQEAPLAALVASSVMITTIAEVSFFGRDQAGHDVIASGTIGIIFGNFGDPQ